MQIDEKSRNHILEVLKQMGIKKKTIGSHLIRLGAEEGNIQRPREKLIRLS